MANKEYISERHELTGAINPDLLDRGRIQESSLLQDLEVSGAGVAESRLDLGVSNHGQAEL